PAVTFHLGHGHTLQAKVGQRGADLFELEGLDDGGHQLHVSSPWSWFPLLLASSPQSGQRRLSPRRSQSGARRPESRAMPERGVSDKILKLRLDSRQNATLGNS